jgi:hypothetical protein
MPRTTRDFPLTNETWPRIDAWAAQQGFGLTQTLPMGRIYEKGTGLFFAPIMVFIENTASGVHLESWIRVGIGTRLYWLFLAPAEVGIDRGIVAMIPRRMGRTAVNHLLASLGQPMI